MASIRITTFGGINTEIAARNSRKDVAQVAHNCLLWDGALRPLAQWINLGIVDYDKYSIDIAPDDTTIRLTKLQDAVFYKADIFPASTIVGLSKTKYSGKSNIGYINPFTPVGSSYEVGVQPPILDNSSSVNFTREYLSNKPVNRIYALSAVRTTPNGTEESVLSLIPNQSPQTISYEGDIANVNALVTAASMTERTYVRLYRSISGMDTGTTVGNELDTEWYLIAELKNYTTSGPNRVYSYMDGGNATTRPLDLYLAGKFYPPDGKLYSFLGTSESGWTVAATADGYIGVSERFMYHAWPTENYVRIPEVVTDVKVHYDTVYIGTKNRPYAVALSAGEALPVQLNPLPFPASYECLVNTMDVTAAGAIYATNAGVIALTKEGMNLLSAGVANGVRPLYNPHYVTTDDPPVEKCTELRFKDTTYGAYFNGRYFGFCQVKRSDSGFLPLGYIFDTASSLDGEHPLQKLVTFDAPVGTVLHHTLSSSGLDVLVGIPNPNIEVDADIQNSVYSMPFPNTKKGGDYQSAPKMCYKWKSKKFVFPGNMVMAAAKVVHDCGGPLSIKFYVDCKCVYQIRVYDCHSFRLPPNMQGIEWEIELVGTATVYEVHVAPSIDALLEVE